MKKLLNLFTFYFLLLSIALIFSHYNGQDPKGIVLVGLNPILSQFSSNITLWNFINSGPRVASNTMSGSISIYWYIAHFISFGVYGVVLDSLKFTIKKYRNMRIKSEQS
jgi:hypothetical protein